MSKTKNIPGLETYSFKALPSKTKVLEYTLVFSKKAWPGIGAVAFFHREAFGRKFGKWVVRVFYKTPDEKILVEKVAAGTGDSSFNPNAFLDREDIRTMISGMAAGAAVDAAREIKRRKAEAKEMAVEISERIKDLDGFGKSARGIGRTLRKTQER